MATIETFYFDEPSLLPVLIHRFSSLMYLVATWLVLQHREGEVSLLIAGVGTAAASVSTLVWRAAAASEGCFSGKNDLDLHMHTIRLEKNKYVLPSFVLRIAPALWNLAVKIISQKKRNLRT